MEIKIIQPPQKNLHAEAYLESEPVVLVGALNESGWYVIDADVRVAKSISNSGKVYKVFKVNFTLGGGTTTTNYYKAIGMAVAGNK